MSTMNPTLTALNGTVVYTTYDPQPPEHPGPGWTRFVCLSDTHAQTFDVPAGDVLLHSGDLSESGRHNELKRTIDWLGRLPHDVKIVIAGNHDLSLDEEWCEQHRNSRRIQGENPSEAQDLVKKNDFGIVYLQDEAYTFKLTEHGRVWSVYGSPWQPCYGDWAFGYKSGQANEHVEKIKEVDILLTHGPPRGILDMVIWKDHVGCPELLNHLSRMQKPPLLHSFGHIHEARDVEVHTWEVHDAYVVSEGTDGDQTSSREEQQRRQTIMVNAANCSLGSRRAAGGPGLQPVIVDIPNSAQR